MEGLVEQAKGAPLAEGVDRILVPGELEMRHEAQVRRDGLDVASPTFDQFRTLAEARGIVLASMPVD